MTVANLTPVPNMPTIAPTLIGGFLALVASASPDAIPVDARSVIRQVHDAAASKNFAALRGLMVRDFQWSFGGDADAEQALEAWRSDPKYLRQLVRITTQRCGFITQTVVQCPVGGRTAFRAGFERTVDGWRMRYFVEGD